MTTKTKPPAVPIKRYGRLPGRLALKTERIQSLRADKIPVAQIAEQMGVSRQAIYAHIWKSEPK
jgi:AcrR family transcriptional regulator